LALFRRIDQGDPSLGTPRYNGGLFDPATSDNQFLDKHRLSDWAVARAADILVRDAGQPVDYAYIGVRNLGAIYEGLLENNLRVVDAAAGQVELSTIRGTEGYRSYYTPTTSWSTFIQHTLDPILAERDAAFRAAMDRCAALRRRLKNVSAPGSAHVLREQLEEVEREAREAFLSIKVLDPAMGSGTLGKCGGPPDRRHHPAHAGISRRAPGRAWEWNPIQALIERVRRDILAEMARQGIAVDPARLDDTALLTGW